MSEQVLAKLSEQTVDNLIVDLLNRFLKANLPAISKATQQVIIKNHLDPMEKVTSGSKDLGVVKVGYKIYNLTGLSTLTVLSFEIVSVNPNPKDPDSVSGIVHIEAKVSSGIQTKFGGELSNFLGEAEITGTAKASNVRVKSNASFNAGINDVKLCLRSLDITELSILYDDPISVDIDNLPDIFKPVLKPLENFFLDLFKGEIRSLVTSNVKSTLQEQVKKHLPLCVGLPF